MHSQPTPRRSTENRILAALGHLQAPQFRSQLESVSLAQGEVVYEPHTRIGYVYFPETAVFSMLSVMENGDTVEVGPVGDEGLVGLSVFFGESSSSTSTLVHVAGTAMRLRAEDLRRELLAESSVLPHLLLRYTQMLLAMTGQSAACNKLHSLKQQLARWLLTMDDYVSDELLLTQELISLTLGVRRAGISEYANELRGAGIITYERGHIQIIDRVELETRACECYQVIKAEYNRLYADLRKLALS